MKAKTKKTLVEEYEAFLRVGRVTSEEWFKLDADEQAALLLAQKRIDIEKAVMVAKALQGDGAIATMMREVDGGKAHVRLVINTAVERYLERRQA